MLLMSLPSSNVTVVSFSAHIFADLLGLPDIPVKALRRAKKIFFLVLIFAFPTTVAYGIQLYAQHESAVIQHQLKGVLDRAMATRELNLLVHP